MRTRVKHGGRAYAEVAVQLFNAGNVMLLSSSLSDQLATVALVKRRLLYATVVALSISVLLGFMVAAIHARRLGRLQTAADRIAEGAFEEPVVDESDDEVGQLAASFDRMRIHLAQLDQARREFVANASHELRTPLFSLAGFLELLDDEDLDDATRREFLATTRSQVVRLTKLATDLLDLSRLDVGRIRIERDEVGLAEVARVVAEDFFALADASRHTLLLQVDDDAWAHADEERVQQIVRALVGNSLVHTPSGTTVKLRVERRGPRVALVVGDDGPGIPPEHLEQGLSSLLPRRGRAGLGQRPRACDRARAGGADGRHGDRREPARRDGLHAGAARGGATGAGGRGASGLIRFHVETALPPLTRLARYFHVETPRPGSVSRNRRGYSDQRVRLQTFLIALVAGILGAVAAVAIVSVTGLTDGGPRRWSSSPTPRAPARRPTAGATPRQPVRPRRDLRPASRGVVTLYADLGSEGRRRARASSSTARARSSRTRTWSRTWPRRRGARARRREALRRVPGR